MSVDSSLVDFLLDPRSYPERPSKIDHFETHISHVFVGDKFAYKIKKPVDFGFLDFSTLQKRRIYCIQEVLVNAVLAGDIYLGVRPIYVRDGEYSFVVKRGARIREYAVRMRKIPSESVLSNLIAQGKVLYKQLEPVGRKLSKFHRGASIYRGSAYGGLNAVITNTEENFEQIKGWVGVALDDALYRRLRDYTKEFIEENHRLFDKRKEAGLVRDGHGDLHAQHICLARPPIILDRIEFSKRLRIGDTLEDISFLLMDLEFRGRFDLSANLFASYFKGARRLYDAELLRFYKIYRAVVRAKVEGLASIDMADKSAKEAAIRRAGEYYLLARYYLDQHNDAFNPIVFFGPPGSGKSAIAGGLLPEAVYLRSDEMRKRLAGISVNEHVYVGYGSAIYDRQTTDTVYRALAERTVSLARSGNRVIVDATYGSSAHRRLMLTACLKAQLNPFFVQCFAAPEVLRKRIYRRMTDGTDVSDAHPAILEEQIRRAEDPNELPFFRLMRLNTQEPLSRIRSSLRLFLV